MVEPGIYTVGGTVQTNERGLYIPRSADAELLMLCQQAEFAYVLTPRQMGKSSLMIRTAEQLLDDGWQVVIIDLALIGTQLTVEQWYRGLLDPIASDLSLSAAVDDWWQSHQHLGVTQRFTQFLQQVVLGEVSAPVVIFVDEIDTSLSLNFTDDFFVAVRSLYVARANEPELRRLSFVLIGVAMPGDLIRDVQRTPFNIGHRVDLTDFTLTEAMPLAAGLGLPSAQAEQALEWVLKWTGGHPYLTQRLCQEMVQVGGNSWSEMEVDRLVTRTFLGAQSEQDNNLQFVRDMLTKRAPEPVAVLRTYREIRRGKRPVLDEEQSLVKSHLKLSGVVRREGRALQVRNRIYRQVFNWQWIKTHFPETPWQRIKPVLPLITFLMVVIIAMTSLAVYAQSNAIAAQRNATEAHKNAIAFQEQKNKAEEALQEAQKQTERANINAEQAKRQEENARRQGAEAQKQRKRAEDALQQAKQQANIARQQQIRTEAALEEAKRQKDEANSQRQRAEQQTLIAEQQTLIASLRKDAAIALTWLPTPRAVDGLVLAISATGRSRDLELDNVSGTVDSSLLQAIEVAKEQNQLQEHTDVVTSVAFSPDDETIVSASADRTIRLWDLKGNSIGLPFQGHIDVVTSVAFSPDGKTIASGSKDRTIRLWDLKGNSIGLPFQGHIDVVTSVAFSPDGKTIASGSKDRTIRLWDLKGNSIGLPFQGHIDVVTSVAFSPDGKTIASGSKDRTIRLWDLKGNSIGLPFQGHTDVVTSVAFSPDGKTIVSGSEDKIIRLWDLKGNSIGLPFRGHTDVVTSVAFSPDGTIASGSKDNTIGLWDLEGNLVGQFQRQPKDITSVAFSHNGQHIINGSEDNKVRVWDLRDSSIGLPFQGHNAYVFSVAFSPDGQYIASSSGDNPILHIFFGDSSTDNTVRLWDLNGHPVGQPFQGHTDIVTSVAFSPDGKRIVSGSFDKTIRLWDLNGHPIGQPFRGHTGVVTSVAFSPDGKRIVSGSFDKTIRLWDLDGNPIGQPFRGHNAYVFSVAFSPNGQYIASSSGDEPILHTLFGDSSTDNTDNTVRLWNLNGYPVGQPFQGHRKIVTSVAFSPDGKRIVSGSFDKTVRLWNLNGNPIGQPFQEHTDAVTSVAFSPDGKRIVSGSVDKTVRLWDLSGNPIGQPFKGHRNFILSVRFSPDGKRIVSGSVDKTVRLWHGSWQGWLQVGCNRLRHHPIFRNLDKSFNPEVVRGAKATCERYAWGR